MRIDTRILRARRRGSVSLETVLTLPLAVALAVVSHFVAEALIFRDVTGASVRMAAYASAAGEGCAPPSTSDLLRSGVQSRIDVVCALVDDERGLRRTPGFFLDMRRAAQRYPEILRDVEPGAPLYGALARADGALLVESPGFLRSFGVSRSREATRAPYAALWSHQTAPWRGGYDAVVSDTLTQRGTLQLFPRTFPAR